MIYSPSIAPLFIPLLPLFFITPKKSFFIVPKNCYKTAHLQERFCAFLFISWICRQNNRLTERECKSPFIIFYSMSFLWHFYDIAIFYSVQKPSKNCPIWQNIRRLPVLCFFDIQNVSYCLWCSFIGAPYCMSINVCRCWHLSMPEPFWYGAQVGAWCYHKRGVCMP